MGKGDVALAVGGDGKTQILVEYYSDNRAIVPIRVHTVVISTQHDEVATNDEVVADLEEQVISTTPNLILHSYFFHSRPPVSSPTPCFGPYITRKVCKEIGKPRRSVYFLLWWVIISVCVCLCTCVIDKDSYGDEVGGGMAIYVLIQKGNMRCVVYLHLERNEL